MNTALKPDQVPDTLDSFAKWWSEMGKSSYQFAQLSSILNTCHAQGLLDSTCEVFVGELASKTASLKQLSYSVDYHSFDIDGQEPKATFVLSSRADELGVLFNVASYFRFDVSQDDLLDLFPGSAKGGFAASFRDLDRATEGVQSLDLDSIMKVLQANSSASEVFEAFGLKIRAEQVTTWGTVLILCIQLYLYLYLKGFKKPIESTDKAWDVGWFAVSGGYLSRSILFVTVLVLPVAAVVMLAHHALRMREHVTDATDFIVYLFSAARLASPILGYLCWRNRPRVKPESTTNRNQLFE
jgi:hypothetical protein